MRKFKRFLPVIILILPFVIGCAGYRLEKEKILDSMYASFALYAVNPINDKNNILIEVARWSAPAVLASGLIVVLKSVISRIMNFFRSFHKDASAVYSDSELGDILAKNLKHGILVKKDTPIDVNNHILIFSDDEKNLAFYEQNKQKFSNKYVASKLDADDVFKTGAQELHFFNISEITARRYWSERNLLGYFTGTSNTIKIAVIGFGNLGQRIFTYGVLNNLYSLSQRIEYHIWGESELYRNLHKDFNFMNDDSVTFHNAPWQEDIKLISGMDRVIITVSDEDALLPALQELSCKAEIDVYNPDNKYLSFYRELDITCFGEYKKILTDENIRTDKLYSLAKELNYTYACMYGGTKDNQAAKEEIMEEEWKKLDSFTKGSNIAAAEYHGVRLLIHGNTSAEAISDAMAEMEHIRWCRYHYLNHWRFGKTENNKKDTKNKLHPCLVPFEELSEEDKNKDFEAIEVLFGLKADINGGIHQ